MVNPPGTGPAVQGPVVVGKAYDLFLWLVHIPGTPYLIPSWYSGDTILNSVGLRSWEVDCCSTR
jgi:hypothetical protein